MVKITKKEVNTFYKVFLITDTKDAHNFIKDSKEEKYLKDSYCNTKDTQIIRINRYEEVLLFCFISKVDLENLRCLGDEVQETIVLAKEKCFSFKSFLKEERYTFSFLEGVILGNYKFDRYLTDKKCKIENIHITSTFSEENLATLNNICEAVIFARDFVNEPVNKLNSIELADNFNTLCTKVGCKVDIFHKKKLETLNFGGLLTVNKGSIDPPTFTIIEWKPKKRINKKPYIFIGKGITYDSGGMNIKTERYMEDMKSDMAGGAVVGALMYLIAKEKLPLHIIGLIPATDNRVNGNAMVSGDIITIYGGKSVEITNTDAEGRLILADALSFADKYCPELIIDIATLTGAASRAIGPYGIVAMGKNYGNNMLLLKEAGETVYERIVEFPFWKEYEELNKSDVADINNVSSSTYAGAITAGKFLSFFTVSPYIHLDIAGPAFIKKRMSYRGIGATGYGVRLLFEFLLLSQKKQNAIHL